MEYPRLLLPRIAVWRTPTELQVGGDQNSIALSGVPRELQKVISALDGHHRVDRLPGKHLRPWVAWLLSTLEESHLLGEGPASPPALAATVVGDGELGHHIGRLLRQLNATSSTTGITIVAPATHQVDRVMVDDLVSRAIPHLLVHVNETRACVGPLVIPGLTSCLRCWDLTTSDQDPTWPLRVFQLGALPTTPDPVLVQWASALAISHVRAYRQGNSPESVNTSLTMDGHDSHLSYQWHPHHRECSCRRQQVPVFSKS
ncbi:MAG: hypothetical protein FWG15_00430 [Propionibacteriaceae bacterium]|nr:hypothetical protein [Propionibacteriaceae bacterium]